jgi:hypothetical protein
MAEYTHIAPQLQAAATTVACKAMPAQEPPKQDNFKRFIRGLPLQRKLAIGAVNDPLESEADAMADKVMRIPEQQFVQRKCAHCEEEEKVQRSPLAAAITPFIQTKGADGGTASDAVTQKINTTKGNGGNMDSSTQSFMSSRFGTDFSNVKIHTGSDAVQMNRELNAQAFTVGSDIYFNSGKYNPSSESGKHLLAHELTHTVQQGAVTLQRKKDGPETAVAATLTDEVVSEVRRATKPLGTDEERIFIALQRLNRDAASINAVSEKYKEKYGMSLEAQLRDEMSGSELRFGLELMGITAKAGGLITKIPETDEEYKRAAQRLDDAIHPGRFGWGTDEETIYAVLLPFNKDSEKLKNLKLFYRNITGDTLRADIVGDMSGKELAYALYLINDEVDETAMELDTMLGKEMQWRSSGLYPCENSVLTFNGQPVLDKDKKPVPCTSFGDWATASKQGTPPAVAEATVINCWEVLLLAAYNAGAIDWDYIHNLYVNVPSCNISPERAQMMDAEERKKECERQGSNTWKDALTDGKLVTYKPGTKLQRGDVVFFNGLEHVALATGNGSEVYTFWPAPDVPFTFNSINAVKDRVKRFTIEELGKSWTDGGKPAPVVEFSHPNW